MLMLRRDDSVKRQHHHFNIHEVGVSLAKYYRDYSIFLRDIYVFFIVHLEVKYGTLLTFILESRPILHILSL
jgi:hypothetical protein